jgi:hypothetical protein
MNIKERCRKEVVDMHDFFTEWYTGLLTEDNETFRRFSDGMHHAVTFVGTDGDVVSKNGLIDWIKAAYRSHEPNCFSIEIKNFNYIAGSGGLHILTYEEWQYIGR